MALIKEYEERDHWDIKFMEGWTLIAVVEESRSYETDQTRIYSHPDGHFALATASGCSCWDGDWQIQEYETLEDIAETVGANAKDDSGRLYNPSFEGAKDLIKQAREALVSAIS